MFPPFIHAQFNNIFDRIVANRKQGKIVDAKPLNWTFISEIAVPQDVTSLLADGELAIAAYQTVRDSAIFTNKRLIVRDAQGLTGKKVEIYSLPYSSINMWSSENAGKIDFNSELELWTRAGHIKIRLSKGIDVRKLDRVIANSVLGAMS